MDEGECEIKALNVARAAEMLPAHEQIPAVVAFCDRELGRMPVEILVELREDIERIGSEEKLGRELLALIDGEIALRSAKGPRP